MDSGDFRYLPAAHDARHTRELAASYLQAVARGEPSDALAINLAAVVAGATEFRLALAVLAGGSQVHARATELAESVLHAPAAFESAEDKRQGGA